MESYIPLRTCFQQNAIGNFTCINIIHTRPEANSLILIIFKCGLDLRVPDPN